MTQHLVDLGGYRLATTVQEAGSPPVVFVSALGLPASTWQPTIDRLTVSTTLITYDRPGCGDVSDQFTGELASVARPVSWAAEQLHTLLRSVDVSEPVVLIGHSIGANIADAYAVRWPDEVAGLILVDGANLDFFLNRDTPQEVLVDGAEPGGQPIDLRASALEFRMQPPEVVVPAAVIASAVWSVLRYAPEALPAPPVELDQGGQLHNLNVAERWRAHLVIAHDAGHTIQEEAPQLVASIADAMVSTVREGRPFVLDPEVVRDTGGALRVTSTKDGFRVWLLGGTLDQPVSS